MDVYSFGAFAVSGIMALLLISLVFNFLMAIKLHKVDERVNRIEEKSREEITDMEKRLSTVKEELLKRKGYLLKKNV